MLFFPSSFLFLPNINMDVIGSYLPVMRENPPQSERCQTEHYWPFIFLSPNFLLHEENKLLLKPLWYVE